MTKWKETLITARTPIRQAIQTIDDTSLQIALVVNDTRSLVGTVTDGDIRRGILRGIGLDEPVELIMNPNPVVAMSSQGIDEMFEIMKRRQVHQLPIVDEQHRVVGIKVVDDIFRSHHKDNWVVLMAGGLGSRLRPLTDDCPKPLLKVGSKPLLETTLMEFKEHGFRRFYISVNYKAKMLSDYFGDGSRWGIEIRYIHEDKRLGTAGALSLLPERPDRPVIVMNGDLLTKVNFRRLLDFHVKNEFKATMCVREYEIQVPYGVVQMDEHKLVSLDEKPTQSFFVNGGIYVLDQDILALIPADKFYDMTTLFEDLLDQGLKTAGFPIREYWLDIGQMRDLERANGEFETIFK